jgi:rod shape-determining protein MreB
MGVFAALSTDLAIDLGTANTCIYIPGRGIVVNEPSMVAFNVTTGSIEAVGTEAKDMVGRTPANIRAVKPMKDGVIAEFDVAEQMLVHFMRKATGRSAWARPRVVIGVPAEITQVERRAVRDGATRAKAREVHLVDEPMAAAIGAGLPIGEAVGNMIVDIGGGTTDIAVISLGGVVYGRSLRVGGNRMDEAIISHFRKEHNLLIGEPTAERVKMEIGSAAPLEHPTLMEVRGRHLATGVPSVIKVCDAEVREALAEPVRLIVQAVRDALERIPPELCGDIYERGVVLSGGGSMLKNFDARLREETGLPVQMAEEPLSSVVLGAGKMLDDFRLLQKVALN